MSSRTFVPQCRHSWAYSTKNERLGRVAAPSHAFVVAISLSGHSSANLIRTVWARFRDELAMRGKRFSSFLRLCGHGA